VVADAPLETMRGGTRGISLETRTPLDAAAREALATLVGAAVVEAGGARVRVASQDAALLAVVARWCDERGATVVDLRLGNASLEDAYRALMDAPDGGGEPRAAGGA
jgi:2,3-bisphosphoglycerate-independent phosphoglycerate mutase